MRFVPYALGNAIAARSEEDLGAFKREYGNERAIGLTMGTPVVHLYAYDPHDLGHAVLLSEYLARQETR